MDRGILAVSALALVGAVPALAQRVDENMVTQATDAFGLSIGGESIGLYGPYGARSFSPTSAGNIRIEGLYFAQAAELNDRITGGNAVAVGITAVNAAFPAPSGIAEYSLRRLGARPLVSIVAGIGNFWSPYLEIDATAGRRDGFSVAYGLGLYSDGQMYGGRGKALTLGLVPRWRPSDDVELTLFAGQMFYDGYDQDVLAFTDGDYAPPRIERRKRFGQAWAQNSGREFNGGGIVDAQLGKNLSWKSGLFYSRWSPSEDYAQFMSDVQPDGRGERAVIAFSPDQVKRAVSGESRLEYSFITGSMRHKLLASVRGRSVKTLTGGEQFIDLGPGLYGVRDDVARPDLSFGPLDTDEVDQFNGGLGYHGEWRGRGELSLGVQKARFRKSVTAADGAVDRGESTPWLYNAATAIQAGPRLIVYAGYNRGLEDSDSAPSNAVNRGDILPAIETTQRDAGLRLALGPTTLIAGVFDVRRPYANLDVNGVYRYVGRLRTQGAEVSLTGAPVDRLNVVAGLVVYRPRLAGEDVDRGLRNAVPAGIGTWDGQINLDYRFADPSLWSVNMALYGTGHRRAKNDGTFNEPARAVVAAGARYRFTLGKTPVSLRGRVDNILGTYGYNVGGGEAFTYNGPRRWSLTLAADL